MESGLAGLSLESREETRLGRQWRVALFLVRAAVFVVFGVFAQAAETTTQIPSGALLADR